jgi:NAD(P)-dependent dehydrogenase (short-subunit alcohol dehydrogenase family)
LISSIYDVVGNDQRLYEGSNLAELYTDKESEKERGQIYSHSVYLVVKGGVILLTSYLTAYWGDKNIRVNCISPGGVYHKGENDTFVKKYSLKAHGMKNIFVCGSSVFPTNDWINSTFTIIALGLRLSKYLSENIQKQ